MEALLQQAEVLVAAVAGHHDLPVGDVAPRGQGDLGEVPRERLARARLDLHRVIVDEGDRAEAVELALVRPAVPLGDLPRGAGELGRERRGERKRHPADTIWAPGS